MIVCRTFYGQFDKELLCFFYGAGVALVASLILNLHLCQLERCVATGQLLIKQGRSVFKPQVLEAELVAFAVVRVNSSSWISTWTEHPVENQVLACLEGAWKNTRLGELTHHMDV